MSSSMKQLAEIVAGFVDRLLVPLIDSSFSSKKRVLEQWNKLKSFIAEAEVVQLWKVENYINTLSVPTLDPNYKKISYEPVQKSATTTNPTYSNLFEESSWKYPTRESYQRVGEKKNGYHLSPKSQDYAPKPKGGQQLNTESFEKLLSSFRKLCTNFQNNHKKLVRDRELHMT